MATSCTRRLCAQGRNCPGVKKNRKNYLAIFTWKSVRIASYRDDTTRSWVTTGVDGIAALE